LRRLRSGSALVLKRLAKFVGSQFLEDIAAFLTDFQTVLGGFLERAESVSERLRRPDVAFLLVLAPETPAIDEALYFEQRLRAFGIRLAAFVVNRVHARPGLSDVDEIAAHLRARPELSNLSDADIERVAAPLARTAIEALQLCDSEDREVERLRGASPGTTLLRVPLLEEDVATLTTLKRIGVHLDAP
jgi:anion-transporting  ArsA/GET3 family ATPase